MFAHDKSPRDTTLQCQYCGCFALERARVQLCSPEAESALWVCYQREERDKNRPPPLNAKRYTGVRGAHLSFLGICFCALIMSFLGMYLLLRVRCTYVFSTNWFAVLLGDLPASKLSLIHI